MPTLSQDAVAMMAQAAVEIERLRAVNAELVSVLQTMVRAGRLGCDAFDFLDAERALTRATNP